MSFHFNKIRFADTPHIVFNNSEIAYSSELRFLGIDITENLKWNLHIQSLCSKLSKTSYIIKSLKGVLSPNMLRSTYLLWKVSIANEIWNNIWGGGGGGW
jgi:hypothetical protein